LVAKNNLRSKESDQLNHAHQSLIPVNKWSETPAGFPLF